MAFKTSMEQARDYNNAGVLCMRANHPRVAWDLFKGALEVKLESERRLSGAKESQLGPTQNVYLQRAEMHLRNIGKYTEVSDADSLLEGGSSLHSATSVLAQAVDFMFDPYIWNKPYVIPAEGSEDDSDAGTSEPTHDFSEGTAAARSASAAIIFNLALVDHIHNRSSTQAISLYELASSLLSGTVIDALGVSIINNIGVWCFENCDVNSAQRCMEHLACLLESTNVTISSKEREALDANIQWILCPPTSVSPAA